MPTDAKPIGLCHRCEHRALYHETGHAPRFECKQAGRAVVSCYCYQPVRPLVLARDRGDARPMHAGWGFSARCHAVRVFDGAAAAHSVDGGDVVLYELRMPPPEEEGFGHP